MKNLGEFVRAAVGGINAKLNSVLQRQAAIEGAHAVLMKLIGDQPPSVTEEIDSIPGRRLAYNLQITPIAFSIADAGRRGVPGSALVSQDGPFIMTHYPLAIWRPSEPGTATNLGLWRPVSSYPLPAQVLGTGFDLNEDIISISYELADSGAQRNWQNLPAGPILSRPDNLVPLPVPTLLTPNTTMQFWPTYNSIRFSAAVPPTDGILDVTFPGYRIVNM